MKIALIGPSVFKIPPTTYGGIERLVWDWAVALNQIKGVDVTLIAPRGSKRPGREDSLIETIEPPERFTGGEEDEAYKVYKGKLGTFDLIHDHTHQKHVYLYKLEHPETKIISTIHGIQTWPELPPVRYPNIVAISDWHVQDMKNRYGYECKKTYHCVDINHFPFTPDKGDRLLFLGLISKHKAPHLAIFLAKKLGLGLDVVGEHEFVSDPGYVNYIKGKCEGAIKFVGRVDEMTKVEYLSKAKAIVLPFLKPEAFSIIIMEALACGCPIVTMDHSSLPEIVDHGVTGFLCDALEGENSFLEAIKKADTIEPKECRRVAEERFSSEVSAKAYLQLYKQVLEGKEW